jgi:hypothetical protein
VIEYIAEQPLLAGGGVDGLLGGGLFGGGLLGGGLVGGSVGGGGMVLSPTPVT